MSDERLLQPSDQVVFVPGDPPRSGSFAIWQERTASDDGCIELVVPSGSSVRRRRVSARMLPVAHAVPVLLRSSADDVTATQAAWSVATAAAVGIIARGRLLPTISPGGMDAWRVGPLDVADAEWLRSLAEAFPPLAHALPVPGRRPLRMRSAGSLIREAWDAIADTLVRTSAAPIAAGTSLFAAAVGCVYT